MDNNNDNIMDDIDLLRASITKQGAIVKELKKSNISVKDYQEALECLKNLKIKYDKIMQVDNDKDIYQLNKKALDDLLIRKMYIIPSFEIYGGIAGFYDFGPPAAALKSNLLNIWKKHFILQDNMLEIECTNLMPEIVLKTSGHVDKFTDLMVKDITTGECYRADKLLQDYIDDLLIKNKNIFTIEKKEKYKLLFVKAETFTADEMNSIIKEYNIKSPNNDNELSYPLPFNLMFQCFIGPEGNQIGYLRPETAQGIFINFKRLLEYNSGKLPFAAAQIGHAFRNEISPRNGLLRVREFQQAEIEYFLHPDNKNHPKFNLIKDYILPLFPKENQLTNGKVIQMTVQDAVKTYKLIANESLAYFLVRTSLFVEKIGIDLTKIRFRQHLDTEMAHYACDCWDLEIKMSAGWIECAGHADRSCYDLKVHSNKSKIEMNGTIQYDHPKTIECIEMKLNKGKIGQLYKSKMKIIIDALQDIQKDTKKAMEIENILELNKEFTIGPLCDNETYIITRDICSFYKVNKVINQEKFIPSVIEPSFGIGRLINAIFEHNFFIREKDEKRCVMGFNPLIAPIKVSILPLSTNTDFNIFINQLKNLFRDNGISYKTDNSSVAIGRKYARADELGIPFNITIDFETIQMKTITIRERNTCDQIRIHLNNVLDIIVQLTQLKKTWKDMTQIYPIITTGSEETKKNDKISSSNIIIERTKRGSFSRPSESSLNLKLENINSFIPSNSVNVPISVASTIKTPIIETIPNIDQESIDKCINNIITKGDEIRILKMDKLNDHKDTIQLKVNELLELKKQYKLLSGKDYIAPNQGSQKKKKKI